MIVKIDSRDLDQHFANIDSLVRRIDASEPKSWLKTLRNEIAALKTDLTVAIDKLKRGDWEPSEPA